MITLICANVDCKKAFAVQPKRIAEGTRYCSRACYKQARGYNDAPNIHKLRYKRQKSQAKHRGIAWDLTFGEWLDWWQATGHYHERGCRKGQYVMARKGDIGPYAVDNIICIPNSENNVLAFGDRATQTHCCRGHELTGANVRIRPDGSRLCRACKNYRARLSRQRP